METLTTFSSTEIIFHNYWVYVYQNAWATVNIFTCHLIFSLILYILLFYTVFCIFAIFSQNGDYNFNPPDGGWGWVVCIAAFWTNGTVFGILNTFGILYVNMLQKFDNGNDSSNLAFKICKYPTILKHHQPVRHWANGLLVQVNYVIRVTLHSVCIWVRLYSRQLIQFCTISSNRASLG